MTQDEIPQWSDEAVAESFRAEIRARFEAHNTAFRAREAAELEAVLLVHPEKQGQAGYEVHDSGAWRVYQESEIRIERNVVTIVLPVGFTADVYLMQLFDHTTVAWSRPWIKAALIDGVARTTIEIILVATWDDAMNAAWKKDGNDRRQILVELYEEDVRALADACDQPRHAACNCGDYPAEERPCRYCAGMPLAAELLLKIRDQLRLALVALP